MSQKIFLIIAHSQTALSALVAFLSLWIYHRSKDNYLRLIGLVFFFSFLANSAAYVFFLFGKGKLVNVPQNIFSIVSFLLFNFFYYEITGKKWKPVFISTGLIFVVFSIYNFLFVQKQSLNSVNYAISALVMIVFAVLYFHKLLQDLPSIFLHRIPLFWINSAILVFNAGTLILFALTSYLSNVMKGNMLYYWSFHNILSIAEHIMIFVGLRYSYFAFKRKGRD